MSFSIQQTSYTNYSTSIEVDVHTNIMVHCNHIKTCGELQNKLRIINHILEPFGTFKLIRSRLPVSLSCFDTLGFCQNPEEAKRLADVKFKLEKKMLHIIEKSLLQMSTIYSRTNSMSKDLYMLIHTSLMNIAKVLAVEKGLSEQ